MDHLGLESSLEIIQILKDDVGPYAKIKVTLVDKELVVRWGLDEYTYESLSKLINTLFPGQFPNENYKCFLSFEVQSNPDSQNTGWVTCQFGAQETKLYFQCSDLYKANLLWLQSVESVEELEHLAWDRWIESYFTIDNPQLTQVIVDADQKSHLPRLAIVLIALCIFASSGWFGFSYLHHSTSKHGQSAAIVSVPAIQTKNIMHSDALSHLTNDITLKHANAGAGNVGNEESQTAAESKPTLLVPNPQITTSPEVYKLPSGEVALTFDDGPSAYTNGILQILAANHIHATFFFVGNNVEKWPNVVQETALQGNEVEDHSVDHGNLTTMTTSRQKWEIEYAAQEIETYTNQPVTLFRPPYESFNNTTKSILEQDGMALALWNRDTLDWEASSPDEVIQSVLSQPASGSVFLLHDKLNTMLALPSIIHALQAQNLRFVVLPAPKVPSQS